MIEVNAAAHRLHFTRDRGTTMSTTMEIISDELLATVAGGADPGYNPSDNALGRVGPGTSWKWLGNYYTPEALAHDKAVRANLARGDGRVMSQVEALPKLPAAIGSYFRARFHPGPNDMHLPD
jgi:hypothetical protein